MYDIKITPILLHAFNFANVLVLGLQLVVMPQMVDRSDYIKSDIFANKLNLIEYTLSDCEEFSKNASELDQYHNSLLSVGNTIADAATQTIKDDSTTNLRVMLKNIIPKEKQLQDKNKEYQERLELSRYIYLDKYLDSIINIRFEPIKYKVDSVIDSIRAHQLSRNKIYLTQTDSIVISIQALIWKGQIVDDLRSELVTFYRFMQQDSILKEICTYQPDDITKNLTSYSVMESEIFSQFIDIYKLNYEPKDVIMIKPLKSDCFSDRLFDDKTKDETLLYPVLMIMQVCISLLFGIVGQLIISDKTVTEAL